MINSINILKAFAAAAVLVALAVYKWGRYFSKMDPKSGTSQSKTAEDLRKLAAELLANSSAPVPRKIENARIIPSEDNLIQLIKLLSQRILNEKSWKFEGAFRVSASVTKRDEATENLYAMESQNYAEGLDKLSTPKIEGELATSLLKGFVNDLVAQSGQDAINKLQGSPLTELLTKVSSTEITLLNPHTLRVVFPAIQNLKI